jgi:DNA gyrase subunit A
MGLIQAIQHFIDHRIDVVRRRTAFLLQKAKDREHILEGYEAVLDRVDDVVAIIRASANRTAARDYLVEYFKGKLLEVSNAGRDESGRIRREIKVAVVQARKPRPFDHKQAQNVLDFVYDLLNQTPKPFSARQADSILELQLHRLTRLSIDEILKELAEIRHRIAEYETILGSEKKLRSVIVDELKQIRKDYADERRTIIVDEAKELELEDLIADEQVAVTVSHAGYLKRTPISIYRQQRRGGTGRKGMSTREEDFVERLFVASTHAYILVFTNTGRVYWLKVYEIPDVAAAGRGKHLGNLVALQPGENVRALLPVRDLEEADKYVFFVTRKGTVKKTALKDFSNVMSRGIIAIGIEPDDELVAAQLTDSQQIVFLATHEGMAVRFDEDEVRVMGRPAYGVRGMKLAAKDYIVGMAVTAKQVFTAEQVAAPRRKNKDKSEAEQAVPNLILTVTENGYGKRTPAEDYRLTGRGAKGVINVKTTERNGRVVAILLVSEVSEAMLISQYGKIIRMGTDHIREAGRATQGVRLLQLEGGDKVAAAVVIPPEEENGNGDTGTLLQ